MITYNGIELDYQSDALNSLVIKGGLTKIDNLTDRTGTSSTQFNLPRTAKNELALGTSQRRVQNLQQVALRL